MGNHPSSLPSLSLTQSMNQHGSSTGSRDSSDDWITVKPKKRPNRNSKVTKINKIQVNNVVNPNNKKQDVKDVDREVNTNNTKNNISHSQTKVTKLNKIMVKSSVNQGKQSKVVNQDSEKVNNNKSEVNKEDSNKRNSASLPKGTLNTIAQLGCMANTSNIGYEVKPIHQGLYASSLKSKNWWPTSEKVTKVVKTKTKSSERDKDRFNHKGYLIQEEPRKTRKAQNKDKNNKDWSKIRKNKTKTKTTFKAKKDYQRPKLEAKWNLMALKDMEEFIKHLNYAVVLLDLVSSPTTQLNQYILTQK